MLSIIHTTIPSSGDKQSKLPRSQALANIAKQQKIPHRTLYPIFYYIQSRAHECGPKVQFHVAYYSILMFFGE
ncbi:hypothetical protein KDA_16830 [Dictyobacter alpinus]|uniref:Uncharacterized protein n=1 Tax=Dictyobacter alpinus TaxID=2014873 RepID=A0A402B4C5_9CHLR|nr:hypothetical protein KDA_16830 [Dictyobacter alpinus]